MVSLDRSRNDTSVTLDLLRAAAAQMVCIGHGIAFFYPPWRVTTLPLMQNVGVLIFFVLSGFLISFTLIERSKSPAYGFGTFFLERFARIYSGLIPALLLIAIIDGVTIYVFDATRFADYYTVKTFVANLLMLEAYRGVLSGLLQWPPFGSASVLWTLALEFHIYLFVACGYFAWTRQRHRLLMIAFAIFFCQVPLHFVLGGYQPDGIGTGLFALWLAGAAVLASLKAIRLPYWTALALAFGAAAGFFAVTTTKLEYNFLTYAMLVVFIFAILAASQQKRLIVSPTVLTTIRFLADYSFTLYLVHYSIMFSAFLLRPERNFITFLTMVVIANVVAIGVAIPTEMRHREFATLLKDRSQRLLNTIGAGA